MKSNFPSQRVFIAFCIALAFFISYSLKSGAYTVTELKGQYHNGQVFLTWTTPNVKNLQYNVYRSLSKFTSSSQLTSSAFMGFVRDSSSKNIRMSGLTFQPVYFQITDGGTPLSPTLGLYVITCTDNQSWYYAVTVTKLSDNSEDKSIVAGQNSLSNSIAETFTKPLPVYQYSEALGNGEMVDRYVQFGNNQETSLYPAMNSTGSYGFNFYLLKRGSAVKYPLIMMEEGLIGSSLKGNGLDEFENKTITNCYLLSIDDWLPIPKPNGSIGDNTYYCCYHEGFNIYSNSNPVPTDGVVKVFAQHRYIEALRWAKTHLPVDSVRIYLVGNSAGGFGAELTAAIFPEEIAAVYSIVDNISIGPNGNDLYKAMWGTSAKNLPSDILNWNTGEPISIVTLTDMALMLDINEQRNIPIIFDIHGKNDHTVNWTSSKVEWLDSLQSNHAGGIFYWDGREHNGADADFLDSETTPDFFRYATNLSFPAFSNCSINQDPGNGNKTNGDDIGAINGYLDWEDAITDETCKYSVQAFIKDLYAGGILFPDQFTTCTSDITFRRLQNFHPPLGSIIKWKNLDDANVKIQSGSFSYTGGLITLNGITINKSGNEITLKIKACGQRMGDDPEDDLTDDPVYFSKSPNGYTAHINVMKAENAEVIAIDLLGRMVWTRNIQLTSGTNTIEIPSPGTGVFLIEVKSNSFTHSEKLFF